MTRFIEPNVGLVAAVIVAIALFIVVGIVAVYVTPWALLGLFFIPTWYQDTKVRVSDGELSVEVILASKHDVDEARIRDMIETSFSYMEDY